MLLQGIGFAPRLSLVCLLTVAVACDPGGSSGQEDGNGSDELRSAPGQMDTIFIEPVQIIGLVSGDPEYLFGSVVSVATDSEGRIFVGDDLGASIRAFNREGTFLGWVAQEGGGPGEILHRPASIILDVDDRLYVRDGGRITVFATGQAASLPDSVADLWRVPGLGNITSSRSGLARDGRYFYPGGFFPPDELPRYYYASFTAGALDGDTLDVPPYPGLRGLRPAMLPLGGDGLLLRGLNRVPFGPVPVWDVTPDGMLVSSDGASPWLLVTDVAGDTVTTIRLPQDQPRLIPAPERADSVAALDERLGAALELIARFGGQLREAVGLGEGVLERRLPDSYPSVIGVTVSVDGSIWVERWPSQGSEDSRFFDVLDHDGKLTHVVVLNAPLLRDPYPWIGPRWIAGVVRDPETEVEGVALFEVR